MINNYSYPDEFKELINSIQRKYKNTDLLELDGIGKQLDVNEFSRKFFNKNEVKATSDVSIDANANIEEVTILQYNSEISKPVHRLNSYFLLWKYSRFLFSNEIAEKIVEKQLSKELYINDFHLLQNAYCYNFSAMDVVCMGLPFTRKVRSNPPQNLSSFMGQIINFITYAGNNIAGAVGLSDLLICTAWFVEKLRKKYTNIPKEFLDKQITQEIQSFIYSVNQPFRGGIQCVDADTEVLTPNGFKKYNEINVGDDIYTWNNGKLEIQTIDKVNISNYKGEMHRYLGRDIEMVVSPNHRIIHKKNNSSEYIINLSQEIINDKTQLTVPVSCLSFDREDFCLSDEWLQFLTIVLTDGSIDHQKGKSPRIKIFKSKNRFGGELIKELCSLLNLAYTTEIRLDGFGTEQEVEIFKFNVENSKEICNLLNNTKKRLPDWMFKLSRRQANLVIDTWVKFDGNINTFNYDNYKLQCDNDEIANQIQHLCFLAGYGSKINKRLIGNNKKETIYVNPFKRINKSCINKEKFYYDGIIWCPTTKNGIVIFRKNNSIFVSGNSFFTNITLFDSVFLDKLCNDYIFPDGKKVSKDTVQELQEIYVNLMNEILKVSPATFPITTVAFAIEKDKKILDEKFLKFVSKNNLKYGFMNIYAGKTSTLSSCCRLRSDTNNEYFNNFGSGSTKIGSIGVVTLNLPRIAFLSKSREDFLERVQENTELASKINHTKRFIIKKRIDNGYYPLYTLGFMNLKRQYSTCGLVGINEACEIMKYDILTEEGQNFVIDILDIINKVNSIQEKKYKYPHNVEQVPAETSAIKLAEADKILDYNKKYSIYSNQFIPLMSNADILDRMKLQGLFDEHMTGGAICHLNIVDEIKDEKFMEKLINKAIELGIIYFAVNYNLQECKNNHITIGKNIKCGVCGEKIIDNFTRIVGFLVNTKNFHKVRREKEYPERQFYKKEELDKI
ncbi:MAG: anaerobic ribonucleoside-triphosphate reductase [Bacteroidales bacterium]